eukprot:g78006.t1
MVYDEPLDDPTEASLADLQSVEVGPDGYPTKGKKGCLNYHNWEYCAPNNTVTKVLEIMLLPGFAAICYWVRLYGSRNLKPT